MSEERQDSEGKPAGRKGEPASVHLIVRGRVQGVGFRWFVQRAAERHAVRGWVRNLPGGEVEAHAEGSVETVEALIEEIRRGPRFSHVEHLERKDVEAIGAAGFTIRP